MRISLTTQKKLERTVHLVMGSLLLLYVYAPLGSGVQTFVRYVAFPMLVMSGMAMWQAPRVLRWLRARRRNSASETMQPTWQPKVKSS